jgi:hypothetical protein
MSLIFLDLKQQKEESKHMEVAQEEVSLDFSMETK